MEGETSPAAGRWLVLGAYALLTACTQLLWLSFAPITTEAASAMHVDVGLVGDLAAIFPFVYILLALPAGRWLDRRFRPALGLGAVLTAAGALLRLAGPTSFGWQLAGQLVIAAGQPLVLNSITKVATRHFAPSERAMAVSIGSAALFVGILAAVLSGEPLLHAGGLALVLRVQAIPAVIGAALVLLTLQIPPTFGGDAPVGGSLRWLVKDRFMWSLAALVFIGMGTYNAVATWLQPILAFSGQGWAAGGLIAVMTFAGVLGAAAIPAPAAARNRRRSVLIAALAMTAVSFAAIAVRNELLWVGAWLFAEGFLLMACLPVVLDWSEVHVGPERQGAAVGFLLLAGNLGGLVLVLILQVMLGGPRLPLLTLAAVALLGLPVAFGLPGKRDAETSQQIVR